MSVEVLLIKLGSPLLLIGFFLEMVGAFYLYRPDLASRIAKDPRKEGFKFLFIGFALQVVALLIQNFLGIEIGGLVVSREGIFFI